MDALPDRRMGGKIGPFTAQLAERIMAERPHPEQGYRSCMGLIGLGRRYGKERLEAACAAGDASAGARYPSVKSILARGLDRQNVTATRWRCRRRWNTPTSAAPEYYADSLFEEVAE